MTITEIRTATGTTMTNGEIREAIRNADHRGLRAQRYSEALAKGATGVEAARFSVISVVMGAR